MMFTIQRIQYAKTKSDIIAKADGTFVPREKRKRHEEKSEILNSIVIYLLNCLSMFLRAYGIITPKINVFSLVQTFS